MPCTGRFGGDRCRSAVGAVPPSSRACSHSRGSSARPPTRRRDASACEPRSRAPPATTRSRARRHGGGDLHDGGGGLDEVTYFLAEGGVRASLRTDRAHGDGNDRFRDLEGLDGSQFDDVLIGDAGGNAIDGGNGGDVVAGRGGRDRLIGGRGNDVLRGGLGGEVVDDSLEVAQGTYPDTGRDLLAGGPGPDRLDAVDEVGGNDDLLAGTGPDRCRADIGDRISGCGRRAPRP